MSCLNDKLITMLEAQVSMESLAALKDRKDKLTSKLYAKKIDLLVA